MSNLNYYYFDINQKIPETQEIKFEDSLESGELGYKNLSKVLRYLQISEKDEETKKFLNDIKIKYSLNYDRIEKNKLKEKENELLIEHFLRRYKQLKHLKKINTNLLIVLDDKIEIETEKMLKLEKLIENEDVKNKIRIIETQKYYNLSKEDQEFLLIYNKIQSSIYYIKNIKIAKRADLKLYNLKNKSEDNIKREKEISTNYADIYIYEYIENVSNEIKYTFSDLITNEKNLENILSLWKDSTYKKLLEDLKESGEDKDIINYSNYLYPKLIKSLMYLTNINETQANLLVENRKNFRIEIFKNENIERIIKDLKKIERELLECKKVEKYLNNIYNKTYYCPICTFNSNHKRIVENHTQKTHKGEELSYVYLNKLHKEEGKYTSYYSEKSFVSRDSCIEYMKSHYVKELKLKIQIPYVLNIDINNDYSLEDIKKIMNTYKSINNTLEKCDDIKKITNKMTNEMNYNKLKSSYKKNYSSYYKYDIIKEEELDLILNKVIKTNTLNKSYYDEIESNIISYMNITYEFNKDIYDTSEKILTEELLPKSIIKNKSIMNTELDKYTKYINQQLSGVSLGKYARHYNNNIIKFVDMIENLILLEPMNKKDFEKKFIIESVNNKNLMKTLKIGKNKDKKIKTSDVEIYSLHMIPLLLLSSYSNNITLFSDYLKEILIIENKEEEKEIIEKINEMSKTEYWKWDLNTETIYDKLSGITDKKKTINLKLNMTMEKLMDLENIQDLIDNAKSINKEQKLIEIGEYDIQITNELNNLKHQIRLMKKIILKKYKRNKDYLNGLVKLLHVDLWALEEISLMFNNEKINELILRYIKLNKIIYSTKDKKVIKNKIKMNTNENIIEDLEKFQNINDLINEDNNIITNFIEEDHDNLFGEIQDFEDEY